MKKLNFPLIAMAVLFLVTGCSEKFNVAAPYKNIAVVYGLLDMTDTAHYIRIEKAFLDQNKSAITMAQTADSSFFQSINVRIERISFTGVYQDSIHLNRVDLNNEGYPKQPGAFFTAPNYAYKFTNKLDPNYIYRLKVVNLVTGAIDSSDAPVIDDVSGAFYVYVLDDTDGNRAGMDFASTGINKFFEVQGHYTPAGNFLFEGATSPAIIVQTYIRFIWVDSNNVTKVKTTDSFDFNAGFQNLSYNNYDYQISDLNLYSAVAAGMGVAPANVYRLLDRAKVLVYMSTADFSTYQQASATQGTGLTGSEIEPIYTNIKGANALGLYTSRGYQSGKITITLNTIDSLMQNPLTQPLRISGTAY